MGLDNKTAGVGKLHFLLLSVFSFLFIGLFTLSSGIYYSSRSKEAPPSREKTLGVSAEEFPIQNEQFPEYIGSERIDLSSRSVLAIDVDSGVILYEKNSKEPVMPASTSKVITALVALDSYDLDQMVVVPKLDVEGQKINLKKG